MDKKLKNRYFISAVIILILSLIFLILTLYSNFSYLDKKTFEASLEVSDTTGFDLNDTALTFGNLIPGSKSTRNIIIENNYGFPIYLTIKARGEIAEFLDFERIVEVEKNETKKIGFTASISQNASGTYTGEVIVTIKELEISEI